ncbi:DUF4238 domain-containing protein, partial [Sansalvadorimonas sp. 2012CJ34-2]
KAGNKCIKGTPPAAAPLMQALCTYLTPPAHMIKVLNKSFEIKRKHHFIWSRYLKNWAIGKDVHYLKKKGGLGFDSVSGLACERDFYNIEPLNKSDIDFITRWSEMSPSSYLKKLHRAYLAQFIELSSISEELNSDDEHDSHIRKVIIHNSLENLHSYFENGVLNVLQELASGNISVLNDKDSMLRFCSYIGQQVTRTKRFKTKSINEIAENTPPEYKFYSDLFEKNWWFISYMLGLNLGMSLFESRKNDRHIFIVNTTDTPFITSDNPCINIHECLEGKERLSPPEKSDLFFPISPKYAYMINDSDKYHFLSNGIEEGMVKFLNSKIATNRDHYLFSNTETSIREALKQRT